MIFNKHSNLTGTHAFLSASKPAWLRYDEGKMDYSYRSRQAAARGTAMHELARQCIDLGVRLPEDPPSTLALYVNDAIELGLTTEQTLFYSINCYGTADTIGFEEHDRLLRIHDYKSGVTPASEDQLYIYAALFCLEYEVKPLQLHKDSELRIYQQDDVKVWEIDPRYVMEIMGKIFQFDRQIEDIKSGRR